MKLNYQIAINDLDINHFNSQKAIKQKNAPFISLFLQD